MKVQMQRFAEFVSAGPMNKSAVVQRAKTPPPTYSPQTDYYKKLREELPRLHQAGAAPDDLIDFVNSVTPKKVANYRRRADEYIKWWNGRTITAEARHGKTVILSGVSVRVNPELHLVVDDEPWKVKLHLPMESLSVDRANVMLRLMERAYRGGRSPTGSPNVAVLDLAHGTVHTPAQSLAVLDPVLAGEAASFDSIWNAI